MLMFNCTEALSVVLATPVVSLFWLYAPNRLSKQLVLCRELRACFSSLLHLYCRASFQGGPLQSIWEFANSLDSVVLPWWYVVISFLMVSHPHNTGAIWVNMGFFANALGS